MLKKILSVLTAACLLASLAAGCGTPANNTQSSGQPVSASSGGQAPVEGVRPGLPLANEKGTTLKIVMMTNAQVGKAEEMWFWKFMKEYSNVNFEVEQILDSAFREKLNLKFAGNTLPDAFLNCMLTSGDIAKYGVQEKQLMDLKPLIDQYAPDIQAYYQKNPQAQRIAMTPDGAMYTLTAGLDDTQYNAGMFPRTFINTKWLQNLGLEEPKTLDDLYNVLKAFKEQDANGNGDPNDEIPFSGSWEGEQSRSIVMNALGAPVSTFKYPGDFYVADGKVQMPEYSSVYLDYLTWMNRFYSEGLLDKDLFTQTNVQYAAKQTEGIVGLGQMDAPFVNNKDRYRDYEALAPLTSDKNSTPMWLQVDQASIGQFVVCSTSQHPDIALKFANFFFTDAGRYLTWFGPSKKADSDILLGFPGWEVVDGQMALSEYPADTQSMWPYRLKYTGPIYGAQLGSSWSDSETGKLLGEEIQMPDTDQAWTSSVIERVNPRFVPSFPNLYYTKEQSDVINQYEVPITDYIKQMEVKFIASVEPLDKVEQFQQQLKSLGIEEYLAAVQEAYDAYSAVK